MSRAEKRAMIDPSHKHLSVVQQCGLLGLGRSSFYYQPVQDNAVDLVLMAAIDRQFLEALVGFRSDGEWAQATCVTVGAGPTPRNMI